VHGCQQNQALLQFHCSERVCEKLTQLTIGVSAAQLQKALEDGMLVCGRNLHGDTGMLSHKVGHVTWTTAVASAVPLIEKAAPLLRELLRLCPNTLIPGKKLDIALMGCHQGQAAKLFVIL